MKFEFELHRNTRISSVNMVLNSNDRLDPRAKAKVTRKLRDLAKYVTKATIGYGFEPFSPEKPCHVLVKIFSPAKTRLDPPNLYPTVKALIDGMTDAGLWLDDNHTVIKSMTFEYAGLSNLKNYYRIRIEVIDIG
ncbi:TPA: hypothetical protein TY768_000903 [Streptococcus suis]|nr:hypothetical protein [Streptococcus suis]